MNKRINVSVLCLMTVLVGLCHVSMAARKPAVELTAQGEKLLATYTEMLDSLKTEITASAPVIDEQKRSAFLTAYAAVAKVPAPPNQRTSKMRPRDTPILTLRTRR